MSIVDEPPQRLLTVDEYFAARRAGVFGDDEHLELLDGVVVMEEAADESHELRVQRLMYWLIDNVDRGIAHVRVNSSLVVQPDSVPRPDCMVLPLGEPGGHQPAMLLIEVANTSLGVDRVRKARIYANSGAPEYWIVNVVDGHVEVHRDPVAGGWRLREIVTAPAQIRPTHAPLPALDLAELFA